MNTARFWHEVCSLQLLLTINIRFKLAKEQLVCIFSGAVLNVRIQVVGSWSLCGFPFSSQDGSRLLLPMVVQFQQGTACGFRKRQGLDVHSQDPKNVCVCVFNKKNKKMIGICKLLVAALQICFVFFSWAS